MYVQIPQNWLDWTSCLAVDENFTKSILGMAVITAIVGVRQGSSISCFLFILYVNVIWKLKERCAPDGFLKWLHALMLMDDAVILATSRERLIEKLYILDELCESHGMIINESKKKFIVIHGGVHDRMPIKLVVEWLHIVTNSYTQDVFLPQMAVLSLHYVHRLLIVRNITTKSSCFFAITVICLL